MSDSGQAGGADRAIRPKMDSPSIVLIVGSAAALCSIFSFAPQAMKIWKTRDASSVSLKTYALTVSCFCLWGAYGALSTEEKPTFSPPHGRLDVLLLAHRS